MVWKEQLQRWTLKPWSFGEDEKSRTLVVWANWAKAHVEQGGSRQFRLFNLWLDIWAGRPAPCYSRVGTRGTEMSLTRGQRQNYWFLSLDFIQPRHGQLDLWELKIMLKCGQQNYWDFIIKIIIWPVIFYCFIWSNLVSFDTYLSCHQ